MDYCYEFGRAIVQFQRERLDLRYVEELALKAGLVASHGSDGLRDALFGAFDEYRRLAALGVTIAEGE